MAEHSEGTAEHDPATGTEREVDAIADTYVAECVARYPEVATTLGVPGLDDSWSDYSPDGHTGRIDHVRQTIAALQLATPADRRETTAKEAMLERLGLEVELHDAHVSTSQVSVIAAAAQEIRSTFDLMPTDSEDAWHHIARRLATIDQPLAGVRQTLGEEAGAGHISARRQVLGTAGQIRGWTGQEGDDDFFQSLVDAVPAGYPDSLKAEVDQGARHAREVFTDFGRWLESDLAPRAPEQDAVGRERYALASRDFLGAAVDLEETYAWGWDELERIQSEQRQIAHDLFGTDDIQAAAVALDADPKRQIAGQEAFRDWMQELSDQAVSDLAGRHFDIPDPIRRLECRIAPTHEGVIYYTGPAEDFSRPGRMWWAVPDGIDAFCTWREVTTVYHEGVPGHHLQIAQNAYSDQLNRWQRQLCWVSGHGEGWALYAERLMAELGYLDDPGDRMGMLDAHAFRATRVIIDIGMHLQLQIPADNAARFRPGERWTPEAGFEFLTRNCASDEATLRYELDRYLGWPGQAPSYKVGERVWLEARADAQARAGADFDLRAFHAAALDLGSLGLDPLRTALGRL